MKVPIDKMLVNRSSLTREFRMAGSPILQMYTHNPFLTDCVNKVDDLKNRFGQLSYNAIQECTKHGGGYKRFNDMQRLVDNIDEFGVKEPLTGWSLDGDSVFELFGGHHRAIIAYALGHRILDVEPKSFDEMTTVSLGEVKSIRKIYDKVPSHENLQSGWSYNPFPGLKSHRPSAALRLERVYRSIISCQGHTLVDLGCNDGYFGAGLSGHDFEVAFVDRSGHYLHVAREKMKALKRNAEFVQMDIGEFLNAGIQKFDVTVYLDVFYHTILEQGIGAAYEHLRKIIDMTQERLIFSPGRWDKMDELGCSQKDVFNLLRVKARQIRYLGKDNDRGYHRELYAIYY